MKDRYKFGYKDHEIAKNAIRDLIMNDLDIDRNYIKREVECLMKEKSIQAVNSYVESDQFEKYIIKIIENYNLKYIIRQSIDKNSADLVKEWLDENVFIKPSFKFTIIDFSLLGLCVIGLLTLILGSVFIAIKISLWYS